VTNLTSAMTETQLQAAIIEAARFNGWLVTHFRPGMMRSGKWATPLQGHPGWVDLVLAKAPWCLFVELKAAKGKVSPEQQQWLDVLNACGQTAVVWRPADWGSGEILRILTREIAYGA